MVKDDSIEELFDSLRSVRFNLIGIEKFFHPTVKILTEFAAEVVQDLLKHCLWVHELL